MPGMLAHAFILVIWKAEPGGSRFTHPWTIYRLHKNLFLKHTFLNRVNVNVAQDKSPGFNTQSKTEQNSSW